ncbi:MAG TPA: peptidase M49, partial [Gammaproteobacteria bacterium]|nr:peptidase M49 [Gammaproteobacteria bacterium]
MSTKVETRARTYLLEQIEDAAVVQLYADGFASLGRREKVLIWHLYQAALAGRDIYYDQRHALALEMRGVVEAVLRHVDGLDPRTVAEIRRYAKLFWINTGPYNNLTARKFVLNLDRVALRDAVRHAEQHGATLPRRRNETVDGLIERLAPMFLDPSVDPFVTSKAPGPGRDILHASANNLYEGVRMEDLEGFDERYGLNSRLVKRGGVLDE